MFERSEKKEIDFEPYKKLKKRGVAIHGFTGQDVHFAKAVLPLDEFHSPEFSEPERYYRKTFGKDAVRTHKANSKFLEPFMTHMLAKKLDKRKV